EYKQAATYYFSHIAYEQGDYQTAIEGFLKLENDQNFRPIVPYYITQIYYKQKKYDEVLVYGPAVLDSAKNNSTKRVPEIARLIGDSYFIRERYSEAIPYLEMFRDATPKSEISREDYYQLGYAYYRTGNYEKAINSFAGSTGKDSELGQLSTYNVADCYLKLQQKEYARNAFGEAAALEFNKEIQEDAMFNYAKLAFELSYNPFHEAITAFEEYLVKYPNSQRRDEAYEFLLNVYMKTRNYEKALASLDRIQNKDSNVKEAYQIVAYNRGVELFQANDFAAAEKFFDKVFTYTVNPQITAEAKFWKAEISYNQQDYSKARDRYNIFLNEPGAFNSEYYPLANYGIGYANFKIANEQKNYEVAVGAYNNANVAFRKFLDSNGQKDLRKVNDANLRIADCYYVAKSYAQAIGYYDKVADNQSGNRDYAMFQKAMCYGFNGQNDQKAWVLKNLLSELPDSKYEADAKYELAKTYLMQERLSEAKIWYNDLTDNYPNSAYVKRALVDLCLVYVKEDDTERVKQIWNKLYSNFPNDPILKDAAAIVRSTLIEDPEFQKQISSMKILNISKEDIESQVFQNAYDLAGEGKCDQAIPKFISYLQQFQPAFYAVEAHYELAECYFAKGETDKALESYTFVLKGPLNNFTEDALKVAATINYNKKNYAEALKHYLRLEQVAVLKTNILEAQIGIMRCSYFQNDKAKAAEYANKVIADAATPDEIRTTAYLWRGKVRTGTEDWVGATNDFKEVIKKGGAMGAEAKYYLALILYKQKEYKKTETEIFQLVEKYSGYDEWKYKGFLLLSDAYIGLKDYYQSRTTLNAILNSVDEQWVRDEANLRLKALDEMEKGNSPATGSSDVEIDLKGGEQ
ncbi:MAG: tetratricopeptide repeat protein, partial [Crocinitomicaceae bacterium]|nr:tetratricopeptide repeat protein [Crocinitomicaceae bacterium]